MLSFFLGAAGVAITAIAGALMYCGRTGPDETVANLSRWARKLGIENLPEWLKTKIADRSVRRQAVLAFAVSLFVGGFLSGMAFSDYLRPTAPAATQTFPSNHWQPLDAQETLALRNELRGLPPEHLNVLCAIPACADLADSIFTIAHDLKWTGTFEGMYLSDSGIKQGIEIWSHPPKAEARRKIVEAIERATKGRLKINMQQWPTTPQGEIADHINLIIGRKN